MLRIRVDGANPRAKVVAEDMECVLQRVLDIALDIFVRDCHPTREAFLESFSKWWFLTCVLTADDVNLDRKLLTTPKSPITFISIYEDDRVGISMFILMPGAKLPLHRHQRTYGLLKVVSGKVKIQAFNILSAYAQKKIREVKCINKKALLAEKLDEVYADELTGPRIITPGSKNCHEIWSESGPAAFIEIIASIYEDFAPCTFHSAVDSLFYLHTPIRVRYLPHADKYITILHQIDFPKDLHIVKAPYLGPQLKRNVGT